MNSHPSGLFRFSKLAVITVAAAITVVAGVLTLEHAPSEVDLVPSHGSVLSPASRVYRVYKSNPERPNFPLAARAVQLDGKSSYYTWNEVSRNIPQAVRAGLPPGFDYSPWIPDGQLASAGRVDQTKFPRTYKGLDQVSPDWPKSVVGGAATIIVDFLATAVHNPSVWDVWMTKPTWDPSTPLRWSEMEFLGRPNPALSAGHYKFPVTIPSNRVGHHVLWIAWQRNDPVGEVFVSTSDLLVRPTNDTCALSRAVHDGANGPFSTQGATSSVPTASCGNGPDVWFQYMATCTGTLRVDTCAVGGGSGSFDSVVSIWSGSCGSLTQVDCNDNACGVASVATAAVTANTRYFVKVGGHLGKPSGEFQLTVSYDNGTGSLLTSSTGCGGAKLQASGAPNIGGMLRYEVIGGTGATQLVWVGFGPTAVALCAGCRVGTDVAILGSNPIIGMIPCDPRLVGATWYVQAADLLGTTGGCNFGSGSDFTLTDTIRTVVGR